MGWTDRVQLGLVGRGALRVGAAGLPPKEELLLRSVVRVLETQTERLWEFADAPPYDVTFIGAGTPADATSGLVVQVLPSGARDAIDDASSITLPIRPLNLRPLLDRLGHRLRGTPSTRAHAGGGSGGPKGGSVGQVGATRHPLATPHDTSFGLPPLAETFISRVRRANATPFAVVSAGALVFVVDPAAGAWWRPAGGDASVRVSDLAARLLTANVDYLDIEPGDARLTPGTAQRLEALLWHLGMQATPGLALRPVAARASFRLTRWPDFGSIGGHDLLTLKLAALLVNRRLRLDEIVAAGGAAREPIVDFLNACALCDLFAADTPANAPVNAAAPSLAPATPSSAGTRPSSTSRYGFMLHALRSALGIGRS